MKKIIIIVTMFLLYYYESISMRNMVMEPLGIGKTKIAIPMFLFAISLLISCFLYGKQKRYNKIGFVNSFIILQIYIYVVSLLHGSLYIDNYLLLLMPLLTFFFGRRIALDTNTNNILQVLYLLVFVGLVYSFFSLEKFSLFYGDKDYFHSNTSYIVLYFLPLLLCVDRKWIKYGGLLATIVVVVISAKRGGTIAIILGLLVYFFVEQKIQSSNYKRFVRIIGVIILLAGAFFVVSRVLITTDSYILSRFEEVNDEGERGRGSIYPIVIDMIVNSSFGSLCFGHGYDMVKVDNPIGLSAHNDYLEMAYDIGVIGLILLIVFLIRLIKYEIHLIKKKSPYASSLAFATAVLLINTMVSHIILAPGYFLVFSMLYGYIVGKEEIDDSQLFTNNCSDENRSISLPVSH